MKFKIAIILMIVMLVMIVPVYAQETTAEPTTTSAEVQEAPEVRPVAGVAEQENQAVGSGATTLVLLLGLGAIVVVGFGSYLRANNRLTDA
jgi:hypothetical protein